MTHIVVMTVLSVVVRLLQKILYLFYKFPVIGYYIDLSSLWFVASIRFGCGTYIAQGIEQCDRPKQLLQLYEFEGCPFCKRVREVLSVLDLDVMIIPCPKENLNSFGFMKYSRYRGEAKEVGGKIQFPLLVDPNNVNDKNEALKMYESDQIIKYLWKRYGNKAKPWLSYKICSNPLWFFTLFWVSGLRVFPEHGLMKMTSKQPIKPLELWSFEPSPFCKKVRELLSSLEIKYVLRNCGRSSKKRKEFNKKYGHMLSRWRKKINFIQVPLLVDPNTNSVLLESEDINKYLLQTYKMM